MIEFIGAATFWFVSLFLMFWVGYHTAKKRIWKTCQAEIHAMRDPSDHPLGNTWIYYLVGRYQDTLSEMKDGDCVSMVFRRDDS